MNFEYIFDQYFSSEYGFYISIIIVQCVIALIVLRTQFIYSKLNRFAYSVAVIGYPRAGKTTLITSLFAEVFSGRFKNGSFEFKGSETIDRVNSDLALLEKGLELPSTTDQDLFAYRLNYSTKKFFFEKKYKVEVGDFPGEDSEKIMESGISWFKGTKFFQWSVEANAFVFVIDCSKISKLDYRIDVSNSYRAAWLNIKDNHISPKKLRNCPIVLVFSKSDFLVDFIPDDAGFYSSISLSFSDGSNMLEEYVMELQSVESEFKDFIEFFKSESNNLEVIFTSTRIEYNRCKVGTHRVLNHILPN